MAVLQYRIRLKVGSAAYVDVHPRRAGEDSTIVTEAEKGEMYYRKKLNMKLTFQRSEYDLIDAAAFDTEFRILLQENIGGVWTSLNVARFWKTDCTFDVDNKTIEVTPTTFDVYEKVLEGMEKEFNLISLEPPTVSVNYVRQATLQVYFPGSSYVNSYLDGVWFEEPVSAFQTTPAPGDPYDTTNHLAMLNTYGFGVYAPSGVFDWARVVIPGSGLTINVAGVYLSDAYSVDGIPNGSYTREDGVYTIQAFNTSPGNITWRITLNSGPTVVYASPEVPSPNFFYGQAPHTTPSLTFTSLTSSQTVQGYLFLPYVRLLTNKETVSGDATVLLPTDNQFPNGNFLRALPISTANIEVSATSSTTPTRWGKVSEDAIYNIGQYFVKPTLTETLMPVLSTTWTAASAWFWLDTTLRDLQQEASEAITLKDCYKLSDVINKLLSTIGATVGHADDSTYSDFLYAATNAIRGSRLVPVITPKSNVLIGEYDQPAMKAPIRLREVLDLLRDFHNAYWHISESKFRIEHRHYYDNGKSYTTPGVGIDLTTQLEPRTGLPWSYRTSNYKYDKEKLPERIESKWMDRVSQPFEGYAIQVNSAYVNRGNIQQKQIPKFTSDIDFFNVAASDISKDGFVFFECELDGTDLNVPFLEITVDTDESYKLQNGYASFLYAHETYHKHGLPATSVNLNRQDITATTTIRTKSQELEIAVGSAIDEYKLITASLGNGKIERIEQNLSSKSLKLQIKHDTL